MRTALGSGVFERFCHSRASLIGCSRFISLSGIPRNSMWPCVIHSSINTSMKCPERRIKSLSSQSVILGWPRPKRQIKSPETTTGNQFHDFRFLFPSYHGHLDTIFKAFSKIRNELGETPFAKVWHSAIPFPRFSGTIFSRYARLIFCSQNVNSQLSWPSWHHIQSVLQNSQWARRNTFRQSVTWKWQIWTRIDPACVRIIDQIHHCAPA